MRSTALMVLGWSLLGAFTAGAVGDSPVPEPPGYGEFLVEERSRKQRISNFVRFTGFERMEGREGMNRTEKCIVGIFGLKRVGKSCVVKQ